MVIEHVKRLARVGALSIAVAFILASPRELTAHGALKSSAPAANARLSVAPVDLRLTFNEAPVLAFTKLTLTGPAGEVRLGALRVDSLRVVVGLIEGALVPGRYTVSWQIAGKDGHPVRDSYTFSILPGARGLATAAALAPGDSTHGEAATAVPVPGKDTLQTEHHLPAARSFDASSPAFILIRFLSYVGLLGVIGAVAFRFAVLSRYRAIINRAQTGWGDLASYMVYDHASRRAADVAVMASALLTVTTVFRLWAQARAVHGGLGEVSPAIIGAMLTDTMWGWGWILQFVLSVLAAFAFLVARLGRGGDEMRVSKRGSLGWWIAFPVAVLLAFTPGLAGHAIASARLPAAAVVSDGLHVIAASGWLGSLTMLLVAGIPAVLRVTPAAVERGVYDLVHAFSPTALAFATVLAITGVFASWIHLGELADLWRTEYGRILLWKVGALSAVIATGAYNWLRVRPALGKVDDRGTVRLQRSAKVEIAVAALVLLITSVLVATPTPGEQPDQRAGLPAASSSATRR